MDRVNQEFYLSYVQQNERLYDVTSYFNFMIQGLEEKFFNINNTSKLLVFG